MSDRTLAKLFCVYAAIAISLILAGVIDNYLNTPTRGCKPFETGTNYAGFSCKGGSFYIQR